MKIEKLNENQIRCTLTHADLAARHLKLSELAYGTEKAKSLFRDMMQQASFDFGFEAENIPLMIEAIPVNAESIILIITKVEDPEELLDFQPQEVYGSLDHRGLVREYNEDYQTCIQEGADLVNTTGIYITLVSGLLEIFGWDMMLMALGIDAKAFGETANRYAAWVQQYFNALADCDAPVITVHDDIVWTSGPFVSPEWYRRYVFPNYKKYFAPLLEAGKKIIFTSDGTYTEFLEDIADCGVHGFVMEPTTDLKYAAERFGKTHVLIGNVDTRFLLMGSREDIYRDVKRCIDIGRECPGYIMAVGNHIPANTPVEKALYYNEVFEKLRRR